MPIGLTDHAQRRLRWCLSLAAAIALLQPALVAFDVDLSGWLPDHDHLTTAAGAHAADHAHPYDHHHDASGEHADSPGAGDEAGAEIVFVSGDDAAGTALPASTRMLLDLPRSPSTECCDVGGAAPVGLVVAPAAPPPRI